MNDLFQSAVKVKQAEVDKERRRFNSCPTYYQNTLFHPPELKRLRRLNQHRNDADKIVSNADRLAAARQKRVEGNEAFNAGDWVKAKQLYEQAYGVFCHVDADDERWRKGLKDDEVHFRYVDAQQDGVEVVDFLSGLLCNTALVCVKTSSFEDAKTACREVLGAAAHGGLHQQFHLKASFWLARALAVDNPGATSIHVEQAVEVLQPVVTHWSGKATSSEPADAANYEKCRELLKKLASEKASQASKDRTRFGGMFEKGSLSVPESAAATAKVPEGLSVDQLLSAGLNETGGSATSPKLSGDWFEQAEQCRNVVDTMRREERDLAAADQMERQLMVAACEKLFVEVAKPMALFDYIHPAPQLATYARKLQLDPSDQLVINELSRLRDKHFTEVEVDSMSIVDVETELLARGALLHTIDNNHLTPSSSWADIEAQVRRVPTTPGDEDEDEPPLYPTSFDYSLKHLETMKDPKKAAHEKALRGKLKGLRVKEKRSGLSTTTVGENIMFTVDGTAKVPKGAAGSGGGCHVM